MSTRKPWRRWGGCWLPNSVCFWRLLRTPLLSCLLTPSKCCCNAVQHRYHCSSYQWDKTVWKLQKEHWFKKNQTNLNLSVVVHFGQRDAGTSSAWVLQCMLVIYWIIHVINSTLGYHRVKNYPFTLIFRHYSLYSGVQMHFQEHKGSKVLSPTLWPMQVTMNSLLSQDQVLYLI